MFTVVAEMVTDLLQQKQNQNLGCGSDGYSAVKRQRFSL